MKIVNDPELKTQRQYGYARQSHHQMLSCKKSGLIGILFGVCQFEAVKRILNTEQAEAHIREAMVAIKMGEANWREGRKHERRYQKVLDWFPQWYEKKRHELHINHHHIKAFRIELYFPQGEGEWRLADNHFSGTELQADLRGQKLLDETTGAVEYAIHLKSNCHYSQAWKDTICGMNGSLVVERHECWTNEWDKVTCESCLSHKL